MNAPKLVSSFSLTQAAESMTMYQYERTNAKNPIVIKVTIAIFVVFFNSRLFYLPSVAVHRQVFAFKVCALNQSQPFIRTFNFESKSAGV